MRVHLIGKSNGVGLTRDLKILENVLSASGCDVTVTITGSRESGRRKSVLRKWARALVGDLRKKTPRYDVNVMLEHVWVQFMQDARTNVVVPNPDFFDRHDVAALPQADRVWAKTANTMRIFQQLGSKVALIGFDSEDRLDANCVRQRTCFHLAGSSPLKGTARLLECWSHHPEWPTLIVVGRFKSRLPAAANIRVLKGYMDDAELKRLQNESAVHLCTSETEGWGHYLAEGLSVGAMVVTLAAPPMNELVTSERGVLLPCRPEGFQRLAQRYVFDAAALDGAIDQIVAMSSATLADIGDHGRRWFLENKAGFQQRIQTALAEL